MENNLMEEALIFVKRVMEKLSVESSEFEEFFGMMSDFDHGILDSGTLSSVVKAIFRGHDDLIAGFNKFLPENYAVAKHIVSSRPQPSLRPPSCRIDAHKTPLREKKRKTPWLSGRSYPGESSEKLKKSIEFLNEMRKRMRNDVMYRRFLEALDKYGSHKDIHILDDQVSTLFEQNPEFYISFTGQMVDIFEAMYENKHQDREKDFISKEKKEEEHEEIMKKQKTSIKKFGSSDV